MNRAQRRGRRFERASRRVCAPAVASEDAALTVALADLSCDSVEALIAKGHAPEELAAVVLAEADGRATVSTGMRDTLRGPPAEAFRGLDRVPNATWCVVIRCGAAPCAVLLLRGFPTKGGNA